MDGVNVEVAEGGTGCGCVECKDRLNSQGGPTGGASFSDPYAIATNGTILMPLINAGQIGPGRDDTASLNVEETYTLSLIRGARRTGQRCGADDDLAHRVSRSRARKHRASAQCGPA